MDFLLLAKVYLIPIGHVNVQSCLLINFKYKPVGLSEC